MGTKRKDETWKDREAKRAARAEEECQEVYRKFGLSLRGDPLDEAFNDYPYWFPGNAKSDHKTALRELHREYYNAQIEHEIQREAERTSAETARLAAMTREERATAAGAVAWVSPLAMNPWFHVLLRILYALKKQDAVEGMHVLWGDKESAELWRLGLINADSHPFGADRRKAAAAARRLEDGERFVGLALNFRDRPLRDLPTSAFGRRRRISHAVKHIVDAESERLAGTGRKPPSPNYVRKVLEEKQMTAQTYLTFPSEKRRAAS
jgi:hypothetical protein